MIFVGFTVGINTNTIIVKGVSLFAGCAFLDFSGTVNIQAHIIYELESALAHLAIPWIKVIE